MLIGWLVGICDRICAVVGAFACSQVPLFYQQYTQRLAGHVAEAELQVMFLQETAARSGKTLEAYIGKFLSQTDTDFIAQGHLMEGMVTRLSSLKEAYGALVHATPWWKPYYFARYSQTDIAEAAFRDFSPGLSLTLESALYACVGMLVGYVSFQCVRTVFQGIKRLRRGRRSAYPTPSPSP